MAEIHSKLFFTHVETDLQECLRDLFTRDSEDDFTHLAADINPDEGESLAEGIIEEIDGIYDLAAEAIFEQEGYSVIHLVHPSYGDELVGHIVQFLHALCPGVQVQAWGCSNEEMREFWYRMIDDNLVRKDDEPFSDDDADQQIRDSVYAWWHEGMPRSFREGLLNSDEEDADDYDDEEYDNDDRDDDDDEESLGQRRRGGFRSIDEDDEDEDDDDAGLHDDEELNFNYDDPDDRW